MECRQLVRERAGHLDQAGSLAELVGSGAVPVSEALSVTDSLAITSLRALRAAEEKCTRCPLYKHATQVVPGEGPARAKIIFVGEQPGDQEDKQGKPLKS